MRSMCLWQMRDSYTSTTDERLQCSNDIYKEKKEMSDYHKRESEAHLIFLFENAIEIIYSSKRSDYLAPTEQLLFNLLSQIHCIHFFFVKLH